MRASQGVLLGVTVLSGFLKATVGFGSFDFKLNPSLTGVMIAAGPQSNIAGLLQHATQWIAELGLSKSGQVTVKGSSAVGDEISTTLKFIQAYKGVDVIGNQFLLHYDTDGNFEGSSGAVLNAALDTNPQISAEDARKILVDRYQQEISLSEEPVLRVFEDFNGTPRLVYVLKTKSTPTHFGKEVFLDAHQGRIILEINRAYDADASTLKRSVYRADTPQGLENRDEKGAPKLLSLSFYKKVIQDGKRTREADIPAMRAYVNTGKVYEYYKDTFGRKSFDNKDTRIISVVHMGPAVNAFWTSELGFIAYGDGDGQNFIDFTNGLDITGHELTHAVTDNTAQLIYASEPGALNESYSDFFGRMIDYDYSERNWDIGREAMGPRLIAKGRHAIRNMENPEEFKQPNTTDSSYRIPVTAVCNEDNDNCGVHRNSGIPNRAAILIVKGNGKDIHGIGKQKAEKLYYNVLTQRLVATSNFRDARIATEKACVRMFGQGASECIEVAKAYDAVKIFR